jgi:ribonucleotide reductase beta subunit family protein with ferritin-like domain
MGILGQGVQEGLLLKPVKYKWAMDLYDQAVANTWFPNEIQLGEDIADFKKMTDEERHAITFLMSYFNPSELLVNKALAFGVYPYINAPEAHLYLAKQMWEEANHCMSFEYVLETFPIDREQSLHLKFGINLILTVLEENPDLQTPEFAAEIRQMILDAVEMEEAYNHDLLPNGILGLNANYINQYVKYLADRRLEELGFETEYNVSNPAKWMATANDTLQLVNFFESTNTSYEVNATSSR